MEDQHPSANNTRETECTIIPITEGDHQYFDGRRIHRVPDLVRFNTHKKEDYYAPKMVSFGPYYHGLPKLGMAEEFKHKVLTDFVLSGGKDREFFYSQIFKVIDQIRNCYVGVSRDAYDDGALAEMMLLDASFAIYLMQISVGDGMKDYHFRQHLGTALRLFAFQDLSLLDNQIPLWVIELLTNLIYGNKEVGPMLICGFSNCAVLPDSVRISITGEGKKQPLHLVAAYHQLLVKEPDNAGEKPSSYCSKNINFKSKCRWWPCKKENPNEFGEYNRQSHSVTDLKAKGIHFEPSSCCLKNINLKSKCRWWRWKKENPNEFGEYNRQSYSVTDLKAKCIHFKPSSCCLKNINLKSKCRWWLWKKEDPDGYGKYNRQSHSVTDLKAKGIHFKPSSYCLKNVKFKSYKFYGQLQLPVWIFTNYSKQFFLQMIAYEASPESNVGYTITCYVNFLKSLIVKSEDVKELRENKILFSTLDSDEQVVEVIKGINTCGLDSDYIFSDVKKRIEVHCSSKAKTWITELINTNFRSPWTFITLVAATFLLCLTFLQTYYTMNPIK